MNIIGAGIGGLATATLLARAGWTAHVHDRAPELRPVGAGLLIQPTGMRILDRIGVGDRVRSFAAPVARLRGTTPSDRTVLHLAYADLRPGLHGFGVHRAALHAALLHAATGAGVAITTGADIQNPADCGKADLVVIADGARSSLRRFAGEVRRERRYPWGALWFVAERPADFPADTLRQVYRGTKTMLGFLPSGRVQPGGPETVSAFWSLRDGAFTPDTPFDLGAWRREATALLPAARSIIDQVRTRDDLIYAPYFDVHLRQRPGPVVAIGDAAHATSPQLGQGANLALADAAALADALTTTRDIPAAIATFARARRATTRYYRVVSRWLTPFFQSDLSVLAWPRDLLMGPACRFPPTRDEMLITLAGGKTGWLPSTRRFAPTAYTPPLARGAAGARHPTAETHP